MTKPLFNKVAIVGVGLIGGSLGLAIRKRGVAENVVGVVRRRVTATEALRKHAVQSATMNVRQGLKGADLVLLCSPVSTILEQIKSLARYLEPNALVMDVASAKVLVDHAARKYLKNVRFIGAHPMAGSSKKGARYAEADLFEKSVCFLTEYDKQAENFWRALGAKVYYLTAEKHDEWVARISHLPHILAFTLFQSDSMSKLKRFGLEATNPSIRDLARLSKSDPKLWADILLSNKDEILRSLSDHAYSLARLKDALTSKDAKAIEQFIHRANANSKKIAP